MSRAKLRLCLLLGLLLSVKMSYGQKIIHTVSMYQNDKQVKFLKLWRDAISKKRKIRKVKFRKVKI